ncbi:hypothetical protein PFICI_13180 [Pestalotiopsis fici W106-1]|uniref:Uncharacterized protein n=1 Tax=Pestalotiopsis fici (strain W106-1 / CGMCC3.15140) TaxID=1229662 RepID=W3WPF4_PESFW|nr:uncharacterized protein PFICI_13180 [Pestalotiopsis fici W106-1]ETS74696.1 hypothetical protein PFICI_13180 [Pestalotiopsis fici W106-1]
MRGSLRTSKPSKPDPPFVPFAIDDYAVDGYAFNGYAIDGPVQDVHNESHTHELLDSIMMRITKSSVGEDDTLDEEDLQAILDDAETTTEEREATSGALGDCLPALDDHDADFADVDDDNQQEDDEDDDNDKDTMT